MSSFGEPQFVLSPILPIFRYFAFFCFAVPLQSNLKTVLIIGMKKTLFVLLMLVMGMQILWASTPVNGPKLDFKLRDSMNRIWQCGTIQLDMNLPERFDLTYVAEDGSKKRPVMVHRALFGSLERFIGILIEHYAGLFPTWLAPVQAKIIPVNLGIHQEYCEKLEQIFKENGIRYEADYRDEKLGYRIRESQIKKVPYALVIGDNEMNNNLVTYRKHGTQQQITVTIEEFVELIKQHNENLN